MPAESKDGDTPTQCRVLLVDHYPFFRAKVSSIIDSDPNFAVCATAAGHREALEAIAESQPGLIVTDLFLGREDGLALVKDIRTVLKQLPILLLTMHSVPFWADRAFQAGVNGVASKREVASGLVDALRQVLAGQRYMTEELKKRIDSKWRPSE